MANTNLFVFLLAFWTIASMITNLTGDVLLESQDPGYPGSLQQIITDIPVVGNLIGIMTFQYASIPVFFSILLDMVAVLSAFVIFGIITQALHG